MPYRYLLNFWPLVPALDIQEVVAMMNTSGNNNDPSLNESFCASNNEMGREISQENALPNEVNYLLVGNSIGCLIKTISRIGRHENKNVNIYIAETFPESLTRSLLLLSIFSYSSELSLLERAEVFLEILGNMHIRFATVTHVENMAANLLTKVGFQEQIASTLPLISFKHLKQREMDELVRVLSYLKDKDLTFDSGKAWDNALRSYFNQGYDNRLNLFDYNFNLKLNDYSIINLKKYIDWCETGIAFKFRQSKYNNPNKTLRIQLRDTRHNRSVGDSYVGDIATSPYLVFGVQSSNTDLFKKVNGQYAHTSEEISKINLLEMLKEFASLRENEHFKTVKIHLMFFDTLCKMRKFKNYFDAVYIPCDMMHCSNNLLPKFLKKGSAVIFETIQNIVNSTKEQKLDHSEDMDNLATSNGLEAVECGKLSQSGNYKIFTLSENKNLYGASKGTQQTPSTFNRRPRILKIKDIKFIYSFLYSQDERPL